MKKILKTLSWFCPIILWILKILSFKQMFLFYILLILFYIIVYLIKDDEDGIEEWKKQQEILKREQNKCINCGADLNDSKQCNQCGCYN